MSSILTGIRVLDLTRLLPGAICTLMLADLGADVIKIEDPHGGDYARWMPPLINGVGAFFLASNRNKRSVILNLKDERGQAALHRLALSADVLIESYRPNVTKRLHCDYDTLSAINPRLIYVSLSGWGQDGVDADQSGHDLNYVSRNGLLGAMGTPQPLGGQVADVGGAYVGVMGVLAALLKRTHHGLGDYVDVALSEAGMPFAMYAWVESLALGGIAGGTGSLTGGLACYNTYRSSDGEIMSLAALEPKFWHNFCHAVQRPDWVPWHTDPSQQALLKQALSDLFATQSASAWEAQLSPVECCFSRITPPAALADDPHHQSRGMLGVDEAGIPWWRSPLRLRSADVTTRYAAPQYGEHTRVVLQEAGYAEPDIEALLAAGVAVQQT